MDGSNFCQAEVKLSGLRAIHGKPALCACNAGQVPAFGVLQGWDRGAGARLVIRWTVGGHPHAGGDELAFVEGPDGLFCHVALRSTSRVLALNPQDRRGDAEN